MLRAKDKVVSVTGQISWFSSPKAVKVKELKYVILADRYFGADKLPF